MYHADINNGLRDSDIIYLNRIFKAAEEDWQKLRISLILLKTTIYDRKIMGTDYFDKLRTWIDASHALHMNMRGHTRSEI